MRDYLGLRYDLPSVSSELWRHFSFLVKLPAPAPIPNTLFYVNVFVSAKESPFKGAVISVLAGVCVLCANVTNDFTYLYPLDGFCADAHIALAFCKPCSIPTGINPVFGCRGKGVIAKWPFPLRACASSKDVLVMTPVQYVALDHHCKLRRY